jgi:hypothetical protein
VKLRKDRWYFLIVLGYIHQNPLKVGLSKRWFFSVMYELFSLLEPHATKNIAITKQSPNRSKKGNTFSINAIRTILTNPIYVGFIRYNGRQDWSEKRRNNINPSPVIEKGQHDSIISKETWEKAQAILKSRSKTPNRVHSRSLNLHIHFAKITTWFG